MVTGVINEDGSIKLDWDLDPNAQAYLTHYGEANVSDPHNAEFMGYTETNSWTLSAENVPTLTTGDEIYLYVQAYFEKAPADIETEIDKAAYLHDGDFTGSAWSEAVILTKD